MTDPVTSIPAEVETPELDDRTSAQTRRLVEFFTQTSSSDLPAEVVHESKRCLLDFLGLTIAAADEPAVTISRRHFQELGGHPQAHALGTGVRLRVTDAAMVNGIAGHAFDFDDTHVPTILHPTTPLYAAGVALAQWRQRPGLELLAAHALGYEVGARTSLALYPEHYDVGWHMTGTTGQLAAVTASARLLGLGQTVATHALSTAATQAAGHRDQFGTMTKPFHAGHAASAGLTAALLAAGGFTGAPDPLQGRRAMFNVMSTAHTPQDLVDGLGERWEIFRNGVKPYACGVVIHPAVDAVRGLQVDHDVALDQIERIDLHVHPLVSELTGRLEPRTGLEGKFSVVFACAIAMIDGAASERQFSDDNVVRSDVRALMGRIQLVPNDHMNHSESAATAHLRDGSQVEVAVEHATGTPLNRMSDADLATKFHDLVDPVLGPDQAKTLEERVWDVDDATDLAPLMEATVPPGRR